MCAYACGCVCVCVWVYTLYAWVYCICVCVRTRVCESVCVCVYLDKVVRAQTEQLQQLQVTPGRQDVLDQPRLQHDLGRGP